MWPSLKERSSAATARRGTAGTSESAITNERSQAKTLDPVPFRLMSTPIAAFTLYVEIYFRIHKVDYRLTELRGQRIDP